MVCLKCRVTKTQSKRKVISSTARKQPKRSGRTNLSLAECRQRFHLHLKTWRPPTKAHHAPGPKILPQRLNIVGPSIGSMEHWHAETGRLNFLFKGAGHYLARAASVDLEATERIMEEFWLQIEALARLPVDDAKIGEIDTLAAKAPDDHRTLYASYLWGVDHEGYKAVESYACLSLAEVALREERSHWAVRFGTYSLTHSFPGIEENEYTGVGLLVDIDELMVPLRTDAEQVDPGAAEYVLHVASLQREALARIPRLDHLEFHDGDDPTAWLQQHDPEGLDCINRHALAYLHAIACNHLDSRAKSYLPTSPGGVRASLFESITIPASTFPVVSVKDDTWCRLHPTIIPSIDVLMNIQGYADTKIIVSNVRPWARKINDAKFWKLQRRVHADVLFLCKHPRLRDVHTCEWEEHSAFCDFWLIDNDIDGWRMIYQTFLFGLVAICTDGLQEPIPHYEDIFGVTLLVQDIA